MRLLPALAVLASLLAGCAAPGPASPSVPAGAPADDPGSPPAGAASPSSAALVEVGRASAPGGYALRVHEARAYLATFTTAQGVSVFDVSDPTSPVLLGGTPPGTLARSVDVLDYGAETAVAISTGNALQVWNLTDPASPALLRSFPFGSHNVVVHPGANVVYNARNVWDGAGGAMEIVDASDPDDVRLHRVWTFPAFAADGSPVRSQGCHDLTVWPDAARAYCAGYQQTLVLDVTDPFDPVVLTAITNPLITVHHTALPILGHAVLVVGDEWAANAAWGCLGHPAPPVPQAPAGALWFYDLTTPTPEPISHVAAPPTPPEPWLLTDGVNAMCTAHNGVELGDGTGLLAFGWFKAGLLLVDASDPAAPVVLDVQDYGGAVGDARWDGAHVYAADDAVGLAVFEVVP